MNDGEPIADPQVSLLPGPVCSTCKQLLGAEKFWVPDHSSRHAYSPVCFACYAGYVKAKYGSGNTNPDELPVA